eukprot:347464-Chlamydomonas_euryale.AAC.4
MGAWTDGCMDGGGREGISEGRRDKICAGGRAWCTRGEGCVCVCVKAVHTKRTRMANAHITSHASQHHA